DTIQLLRFVLEAIRRGARVVIDAPEVLQRLAATLDCDCSVVARGQPLPFFDVHCPLMSLPRLLGVTLADLPGQIPYLRADPPAISRWSRRLCAAGARLRLESCGAAIPSTLRTDIVLLNQDASAPCSSSLGSVSIRCKRLNEKVFGRLKASSSTLLRSCRTLPRQRQLCSIWI